MLFGGNIAAVAELIRFPQHSTRLGRDNTTVADTIRYRSIGPLGWDNAAVRPQQSVVIANIDRE
jgi:hypothetical protein